MFDFFFCVPHCLAKPTTRYLYGKAGKFINYYRHRTVSAYPGTRNICDSTNLIPCMHHTRNTHIGSSVYLCGAKVCLSVIVGFIHSGSGVVEELPMVIIFLLWHS